jgi:hypothetical protein
MLGAAANARVTEYRRHELHVPWFSVCHGLSSADCKHEL